MIPLFDDMAPFEEMSGEAIALQTDSSEKMAEMY